MIACQDGPIGGPTSFVQSGWVEYLWKVSGDAGLAFSLCSGLPGVRLGRVFTVPRLHGCHCQSCFAGLCCFVGVHGVHRLCVFNVFCWFFFVHGFEVGHLFSQRDHRDVAGTGQPSSFWCCKHPDECHGT